MPFGSLWGKKETELPAELQGLTPEQLVEQLKAGKTAADSLKAQQDKITALEAEAAKVPTLTNQFTELQSRLTAIEANAPKKPDANTQTVPSVLDNEDEAFNARLAPVYQNQALMLAQNARTNARMLLERNARNRFVLEKWGTDVDKLFATVPLAQRGQPGSYDNCFKIVMAEHIDEIELEKAKKDGFFSLEGGGNGSQTAQGQTSQTKVDVLSDEEKRIAKRMGMKEEEYLAQKKGMVFQNA